MTRKHLFELLEQEINFKQEYDNLITLLATEDALGNFCLRSMDANFLNWIHRGTHIEFYALLSKIGDSRQEPHEKFYLLSELILNMAKTDFKDSYGHPYKLLECSAEFVKRIFPRVIDNINKVLDKSNHFAKEVEGRVLVLEKNPAASAVTEITGDLHVLEYNHFALKGNLKDKGVILSKFYTKFELHRTIKPGHLLLRHCCRKIC